MKIRTRLFGSFFIVVAVGIFLGALGLYCDHKLAALSEDILDLAGTRTRISSILDSHYVWRHGLSETVYSGAAFTGSLDSSSCSLGMWLSSDEVSKLTDREASFYLGEIVEPHQFIHAKAGEIINHLINGESEEAVAAFRGEVLPNTLKVITDLEILQNRYSDLLADKINEIHQTSKVYERIIVVFIIIALIASLLLAIIITSTITKSIHGVADTIKIVADGDLTKNIKVSTKDEIGDLAQDFNVTVEKIKNLILGIRTEADALSGISSTLANDMIETAAAVNEITAHIKSINSRVIDQSASVTQTDATMEQIVTRIHRLSDHIERQNASIGLSSSAIEEMLANVQSVTRTLVKNGDNVTELTAASEIGRTGLQTVVLDIQEIAKESEGLLEINSVIDNISSQTNLLSMNAAIEAAHAGEAGKGFAVVADEIRKLAESSSEQSKTISTVLRKMKSSIDKITASTDNVLQKFEAIDADVKTVAEQEENIRYAMEEQSLGSQQILEAIGTVNEITQLVRSEVHEMLEGIGEVTKEADNLKKATLEISGGMSEMASGADQINAAVENVNGLSSRNQASTNHLIKEVSRFIVS